MKIEIGKGLLRPSKYHLIKLFPSIVEGDKRYLLGKQTYKYLRPICRRLLSSEYSIYEYEVLKNCILSLDKYEYRLGKAVSCDNNSFVSISDSFPIIEIYYYGTLVYRGHGTFNGSEDYHVSIISGLKENKTERRIIK